MNRKMIAAVIFVSALSGFLGGILANSVLKPVYSSNGFTGVLKPAEIDTRDIKLVDSSGKMRIELSRNFIPSIKFYDSKGMSRESIGLDYSDLPSMSISDSRGV